MSEDISKIEAQARRLSTIARARLVRRLIATLDGGADANAEQAWLDEAERRYELYKKGELTARPADDVFTDLEARLG